MTDEAWASTRSPTCAGADGSQLTMMAPRLSAGRWTDERKPRTRITHTKSGSHLAAARTGAICITTGFDSRAGRPRTAARCRALHPPAVSTRGTSRRRGPRLRVGPWGSSVTAAPGAHVVALSHGGASAAQRRNGRARSRQPSGSGANARIRSSVSVTPSLGSFRNGVLTSPASVAAVGGVASAPLGG